MPDMGSAIGTGLERTGAGDVVGSELGIAIGL
jgi:hypothetical protein